MRPDPAPSNPQTDTEGWIDATVPIRSEMPTWPDDPRVWVEQTKSLEGGDPANVTVLTMTTHTGTHLDAPRHFLKDGAPIDRMPPSVGLGQAHVLEVSDRDTVKRSHVEALPEATERVLFKTENSIRCWQVDEFLDDYVYLTVDAAKALAEQQIRLVGIDYLSIGGRQANLERVHETLLEAGIWILEGLDLSNVDPGRHQMACLPLRVQDGDGAPARVVVRPDPA